MEEDFSSQKIGTQSLVGFNANELMRLRLFMDKNYIQNIDELLLIQSDELIKKYRIMILKEKMAKIEEELKTLIDNQ